MTTTALMGLVLPDDGASFNQWGILINQIFSSRIDVHDHQTGLGAKVPVGGLNINADLSFSPSGTPRAITDLKAIDFAAVASSAVAGLAGAFFLSDGTGGLVLNELYYRTTSGSNIRVTAGAALNVGAFVGGIGGDYAGVGALLDYDDANDAYRFRQETAAAVRQFAKMRCADIQLVEYDPSGDATVPASAVTLKSPDALAAAYDVTFPAALPGSTQIVQMSSAGVLTASNTVANAVTASALITANAGVTAGANQHVTVSGTGEYKHGDRTLTINALDGNASAVWAVNTTTKAMESNGSGGFPVVLPLKVGDRIKSMRFMLIGNGTADITTTVTFLDASMVGTTIGTNTTNNQAAAWVAIPIDLTDTTIIADSSVVVVFTANAAGLMVGNITYTFDHP